MYMEVDIKLECPRTLKELDGAKNYIKSFLQTKKKKDSYRYLPLVQLCREIG